jgi:hypothetical protein
MQKLLRAFSYAWAAPASCVGLLVALVAVGGGATVAIVDGVLEVAAPWVARWPARFDAITFGHVVIGVSPAALAQCRAHERVHVRQYERYGLFFFALYAASSAWQWLRGRSPYSENYFERQARER